MFFLSVFQRENGAGKVIGRATDLHWGKPSRTAQGFPLQTSGHQPEIPQN